MSILAIVFSILSLIFAITFLIDCVRFRKKINTYIRYGIVCGFIFLAIDIALVFLIPNFFSFISIYVLIIILFIAFIRIGLFACMGMHCCSVLEIDAFPAVRLFNASERQNGFFGKRFFASVGAVTLLGVAYSVILFVLTSPQISEALKQLSETQYARFGIGDRPSLLTALLVLEFAFAEEIVFRLGIQNYLAIKFDLKGRKYWIAIISTTLFWTLAHANTLDPEWVKLAQVFPLGLALGYLFKKYGTESCILVHGIFNLVMMFLAP